MDSLDDSYLLTDANMFAKQGIDRSTRTPTLSQVRAVCTQREPTERVIIVIVGEKKREDKREESREREGEKERRKNDGREREGTRERE